MKKIFLSTLVLTGFAFSLILVQLSCKKDVIAQVAAYILPMASTTKLGGVMVDGTSVTIDKDGKISAVAAVLVGQEITFDEVIYGIEHGANDLNEIWKVSMDGAKNEKIPIVLPAGLKIKYDIGIQRTTKKVIFGVNGPGGFQYVYSCNLDGTSLLRLATVDDDFML